MPGGWAFGCLQFLFLSNHGILGNHVLPTHMQTHPNLPPSAVPGFLMCFQGSLCLFKQKKSFPSALTSFFFFSYLLELGQDGFVQASTTF